MKRLLLTSILLISTQSMARITSGPSISGGGNSCLLNLQAASATVADYANRLTSLQIAHVDLVQFANKLKNEKFETGNRLYHEGKKVDALNFPDLGLIRVEKAECKNLMVNRNSLLSLVVHETLGLLREKDQDYQISRNVLNDLNRFLPGLVATSGSASIAINDDESGLMIRGETAQTLYEKLDVAAIPAAHPAVLLKQAAQISCTQKTLPTGPEFECYTGLEESAGGPEIRFTGSFKKLN